MKKMEKFEIGKADEHLPNPRNTLKDFILVETSENSSGRCSGCLIFFYILVMSNVLFGIRQSVYDQATDFDAIVAVESVLGVLGFIDYFEDCEDCQNDDVDDTVATDCDEDLESSTSNALIDIIDGSKNASEECLYYLFGSDSEDADLCGSSELTLQYNKETDEVNCGVNSRNAQGCSAGFYQPSTDIYGTGPGYPCPDGHWCPANFICKIPCPYGSLCGPSVYHDVSGKCKYSHDVTPNRESVTMYNKSLTCATAEDDPDVKCPGPRKVPLCPPGFYCPLPTTILKCPRGHYCPLGSFEPIKCFRGKLSCPNRTMSYPWIFIPTTILVAFIFTVLTVSYVLIMRIVISRRNRRRLDQAEAIAERAAHRKHLQKDHLDRVFSQSTAESGSNFLEQMAREDRQQEAILKANTAANANSGETSMQRDNGKMSVWIFLGADLNSHEVLCVLSVLVVVTGILVEMLYPVNIPIAGATVDLGVVILVLSCPLLVATSLGVYFLRTHRSALSLAEEETTKQQRRTARASTLGGFLRDSERSSGGGFERDNRMMSTMRQANNTGLLGSLKEKKDTRINIEVDQLGLRLNSNKRVVLAGVDGKIEAGSVTAIMGPSGAGKTTFLNALSGRANYGTTTGRILINGQENNVANLGRLVGFVPQEDTMHRELTVREILKSYALLRLPRFYDHTMIERVVQDVIEALQLDHVSDSIIGDETKRGISGGQRKRVNVGMEMVADPSLLFLDEPTSGLDSTTSFDLIFALKALATKGVNIITVLHQPSYPLYQMFTKVLLLGKGGRTVFLGASSDALEYFTHCKYKMPEFVNPADFFMDVIAGKFQRQGLDSSRDDGTELFGLWAMHRVAYENETLFKNSKTSAARRVSLSEENNKRLNRQVRPVDAQAYAHLHPAKFWRAFIVNCKRATTQHIRSMDNNTFDVILHGGTGLFLGAANGEVVLKTLGQALLMYSLGLGMTIGLASLRVFGNERVVFWREAAEGSGMGLDPFPYFVAKNLIELPRIAILTFCVAACFYPFVKVLCGFWTFFGMSVMAAWTISGYAFFLSITFDEKSAQLILVILCLTHLLYGGIQTTLSAMSEPEYLLSWVSPSRWLIEDLFICHTSNLSAVYRLPPTWYDDVTDSLIGYLLALTYTDRSLHSHQPYWNIMMNFWFGFLARCLAFFSLCYSNRKQMAKPPLMLSILRSCNGFLRVFVPNADLEEDSRKLKKKYKSLYNRIMEYFFTKDEEVVDQNNEKSSRRYSAFDFAKSTLPVEESDGVVSPGDTVDLGRLQSASDAEPFQKRLSSLDPGLEGTFNHAGEETYGGESPFFVERHSAAPVAKDQFNNTAI